jgi:prepilin-type N-terminal cleavage/methylation domain-containing protein
MKKNAFTLSEILITLSIIGIIAAMTIPGLVQDIQDAQFKIAWKNSFADLSQAITRLRLDNGGNLKGLCGDNDYNCFKNKFAQYVNYTKSCNFNENVEGNCWHYLGKFKYMNGVAPKDWGSEPGLVLNNGSLVKVSFLSKNCTNTSWATIPICGFVIVDTNGFSGPNTIGKDIFETYFNENRLMPRGYQGDNTPVSGCVKTGTGLGCAAKYLSE